MRCLCCLLLFRLRLRLFLSRLLRYLFFLRLDLHGVGVEGVPCFHDGLVTSVQKLIQTPEGFDQLRKGGEEGEEGGERDA